MNYLIISILFLFGVQADNSEPNEVPFYSFEDWTPSMGIHPSKFWIIPDLESIDRLEKSSEHTDKDINLIEAHFINSSKDRKIFVVSEMYNDKPAPIFFGLFTVEENGSSKFIALYTRNGEREVWEKVPDEVYLGLKENFARYMFEKLGRYIIIH